jgi:hypothetical protein
VFLMKTQTEPTTGEITRRDLLARMGTGLAVLTIGNPWEAISPSEASARGVPLRLLTAEEGRILNALAEVLLPGAGDAGVAHYVDDQLGRENPSFFLKYMDTTDPYVEFYRNGLRSLDQVSLGIRALERQAKGEARPRAVAGQPAGLERPAWAALLPGDPERRGGRLLRDAAGLPAAGGPLPRPSSAAGNLVRAEAPETAVRVRDRAQGAGPIPL